MRKGGFCRLGLWLSAGVLLAGTGYGCARSERPLSSPEDGFLDHYMVGTWYNPGVPDDGVTYSASIFAAIEIAGDTEMRVVHHHERGGSPDVYTAWSTRVGAQTFLNLRRADCEDCDEDDARLAEPDECPYLIVRYFTYLPRFFEEWLEAEEPAIKERLVADFEAMRGDIGIYQHMMDGFATRAIDEGIVEDHNECVECDGDQACLMADERGLREFVIEYGSDLFGQEAAVVTRRRTTE